MCGIHLTLSIKHHILPNVRTQELLRRRGPDSACDLKRTCLVNHNGIDRQIFITCYSTVLALRGDQTVSQPVTKHPRDDFLCWNGEAWKLFDEPIVGNDSEAVFALLSNPGSNSPSSHASNPTVSESMAAIQGPYAFAYFNQDELTIHYGRDPLGRRALMYRFDDHGNFFLTSVADSSEPGWKEVEADGLYTIRLLDYLENASKNLSITPECEPYARVVASQTASAVREDHVHSHDIDSTFDQLTIVPQHEEVAPYLPLNTSSPSVLKLQHLLYESLQSRISTIPSRFHTQNVDSSTASTTLAILFSGGLDCTVLARMSHDVLDKDEPIDLLNVAFENPRIHKGPKNDVEAKTYSPYELCPDRITGRASFAELQQTCPGRKWRFIAVNIPYTETLAHREEIISLIHPHNTEMDLSIACALYFAARGSGVLTESSSLEPAIPYTTDARVLLSGLGADELFGGYQRHEIAFVRKGLVGLLDELNLDVGRLGKRNLGRDDRVLSNWARETRFPFLDENLVEWAINAPVWERCDFGAQPSPVTEGIIDKSSLIEPGKKVLRCLTWKLGMVNVAGEKKRAIQFGARTAKMEVGRIKGTQVLT